MSATTTAIRAALRAAHRVAETEATYTQDGETVPITPIKSTADLDVLAAEGADIVAKVTIWRVPAAQLKFKGQLAPPKEGDRIEYQTPTQVEVYEAQCLTGDACYEPCDPERTEYKITTRLVQVK